MWNHGSLFALQRKEKWKVQQLTQISSLLTSDLAFQKWNCGCMIRWNNGHPKCWTSNVGLTTRCKPARCVKNISLVLRYGFAWCIYIYLKCVSRYMYLIYLAKGVSTYYTEGSGRGEAQHCWSFWKTWNWRMSWNNLLCSVLSENNMRVPIAQLSYFRSFMSSRLKRKVSLKEGNTIFPVYLFIAMLVRGESVTCSLFTRAFIWASNI